MLVNDVRQVGGESVYKPFIRLLKDCAARRCASPKAFVPKFAPLHAQSHPQGAQGFFARTVPKSPASNSMRSAFRGLRAALGVSDDTVSFSLQDNPEKAHHTRP